MPSKNESTWVQLSDGLGYWMDQVDNEYADLYVEGDGKVAHRRVRWQDGPKALKEHVRELASQVGFRPTSWPNPLPQ